MQALLAQRLTAMALSRPLGNPVAVGQRLFALQAQDLNAARWALGVRCGGSRAQVEAAFDARALVRSWPLRGTLHVVPAEDLEWLRRLLAPRNLQRAKKRHADLGLDDATFRKARSVAERVLERGPLTREALLLELQHAKVSTEGQRGAHLLWGLAQHGTVCLGDFEAGAQRFVLQQAWVPKSRALEGDEALAELAARYQRGHGPVTVEDLMWWAGLTRKEATRAMALAGPVGQAPSGTVPRALLLPGFDEYLLGFKARSAVISPAHFQRVVPGGNGVFLPMVVLDGRIVGTWKRRGAQVECVGFEPWSAAQAEAVEAATAAVQRFFGTSPA